MLSFRTSLPGAAAAGRGGGWRLRRASSPSWRHSMARCSCPVSTGGSHPRRLWIRAGGGGREGSITSRPALHRLKILHPPLSSTRIVVPALPSDPQDFLHAVSYEMPSSNTPQDHLEHAQYKYVSSSLTKYLPDDLAALHRQHTNSNLSRQQQEKHLTKTWEDSKSHLRKHAELVKDLGSAEAAAQELVQPTRQSFREELGQRPLDKGILEEIYLNLHGKRVERKLKKGVSWEHWITKGDGTAPVFTASHKAQQTFGMGGHVRLMAKATIPSQFPLNAHGASPAHRGRVRGPRSAAPVHHSPEFAFIGRTSCGKSSLINAIVNAAVAPYGHLQGTTNALHFYSVAGGAATLVDCPGYGYYNPFEASPVEAEAAVRAMRQYLRLGATTRPVQQPCPPQDTDKGMLGDSDVLGELDVEDDLTGSTAATTIQKKKKKQRKLKEKKEMGGIHENGDRDLLRECEHPSLKEETAPSLGSSAADAAAASQRGEFSGAKLTQEEEKVGAAGEDLTSQFFTGLRDEAGDVPFPAEEAQRRRGAGSAPHRHKHGDVWVPGRRPIKRVFLCASSRGLQHLDWSYCDLLESFGIPFTVVLTKTDAAPIRYLARLADYTRCRLVHYHHCKELMLASALRLAGIDKMQNLIGSMALLPDECGAAAAAAKGGKGEKDIFDFSSIV
eukprot:gene9851-6923_t